MTRRSQNVFRFAVALRLASACLLVACAGILHGQTRVAPIFLSSASLDALDKKLTALLVNSDKTLAVNEPLSSNFAAAGLNGTALLFHRDAASEIEVHETLSDFAVVRAGSGSLLAGGKLENGRRTTPNELRGSGRLTGGTTTRLAVGDLVYVPAKLPHQFVPDAGTYLSVMVFKPAALQPQDQPFQVVHWPAAKLNDLDKELSSKLDRYKGADSTLVSGGAGRRAALVHVAGQGPGEAHEKAGEIMLVRSGSGMVTTGGTLTGGATQAGEVRGSSIENGSQMRFAAGDVLYLPADTAHRIVPDAGKPYSVLSFRFPSK